MYSAFDEAMMRRALALAENGLFTTTPNPRVGCVITTPDGRVIGRGHTQEAGGPHAEVMAMRDAAASGESAQRLVIPRPARTPHARLSETTTPTRQTA